MSLSFTVGAIPLRSLTVKSSKGGFIALAHRLIRVIGGEMKGRQARLGDGSYEKKKFYYRQEMNILRDIEANHCESRPDGGVLPTNRPHSPTII